jgi:dihydrofolate reductase
MHSTQSRKLVLYIAMSLDGFIAGEDGNLDFLSLVEKEGEDYGYNRFVESVDTVILGRRSYEKVLSMGYAYPHTNKEVYIYTRRPQADNGSFHFYNGNLAVLIEYLKSQPGKHIYCDGGAEVVNQLLNLHLIDEMIISIIPILLGNGIRLFRAGRPQSEMVLLESTAYSNGLLQVHYQRKPDC